jgi:hypothetical protein
MHEPKLRLYHHIKAWSVAVRTCLAISRDTSINKARVYLAQSFVVKIVFFERAWEIVLYYHVTLSHELVEDLDTFRVGERQTE